MNYLECTLKLCSFNQESRRQSIHCTVYVDTFNLRYEINRNIFKLNGWDISYSLKNIPHNCRCTVSVCCGKHQSFPLDWWLRSNFQCYSCYSLTHYFRAYFITLLNSPHRTCLLSADWMLDTLLILKCLINRAK